MAEAGSAAWSCGSIASPHTYFDRLTPARPTGKPPVVMIHGGAHTGTCYLATAAGRPGWAQRFVAAGHPVVLPDWPGSGRSGAVPPAALTGDLVCDGLAQVIAELGEAAVVMTHSISGAYGWKLLERCGPAISRMVPVAPAPPGNIQPAAEIVAETETHVTVRGTTCYVLERLAPFMPTQEFTRAKLVGTGSRFPLDRFDEYWHTLQPVGPRLLQQRLNLSGGQLHVQDTRCLAGKPVLIVTGTHDVDHPREVDRRIAEWLRECGADSEHLFLEDAGIEGNGHMMMLEDNSDAVADLILAWLDAASRNDAWVPRGGRRE